MSSLEIILIIIFSLLLIYYLNFLGIIYKGLNKLNECHCKKLPEEYISVIVPFRNEEHNIKNVFESLVNQNYPEERFEIIFVNDNSDDNSLKILKEINKYKNVRILTVPDDYLINAHKKRAIRYGIDNSNGEIIVTTDADCYHNKNWLRSILTCFDEKTAFVSGPTIFKEEENLFQKMQKIEFAGLVLTGAGLIGANQPTICNAANLAYRKKAFNEVNGFYSNMNLSSGDDELLLQKIFQDTDYKIKFSISKDSVVVTQSNKSFKEFYHQRKRWASKGLFYKNKFLIIRLVLIYFFYLALLIQPFLILYSKIFFPYFMITFGLKSLYEYRILKKGLDLLFDRNLLKYFLITEIVQIPYIVVMGLSGAFGNFVWKNRKIKR